MPKKPLDPGIFRKHQTSKYARFVATLPSGAVIQAGTNKELKEAVKLATKVESFTDPEELEQLSKEELLKIIKGAK